jgi:hypothetical protein
LKVGHITKEGRRDQLHARCVANFQSSKACKKDLATMTSLVSSKKIAVTISIINALFPDSQTNRFPTSREAH